MDGPLHATRHTPRALGDRMSAIRSHRASLYALHQMLYTADGYIGIVHSSIHCLYACTPVHVAWLPGSLRATRLAPVQRPGGAVATAGSSSIPASLRQGYNCCNVAPRRLR